MSIRLCKRGHLRTPDNLHPSGHCKICRYATQKANRWKYAKRIATANKKWALLKYGLTEETYNLLRERQDYRCGICERHETIIKRKLCVDHDHKTGEVRGLLCLHCNSVVLRLVENSPALLIKAKSYLEVGYAKSWNQAKH